MSLLWSLRFVLALYYKYITPTGLKTLYFIGFLAKNLPLSAYQRGIKGNVTDIRKKCFKKPPEGDIK